MEGLRVQARACATCIYRSDSSLDIKKLEAAVADKYGGFSGHRICHHSKDACCRGFWQRHKDKFALGQIAQRLGLVKFVEDDTLAEKLKWRVSPRPYEFRRKLRKWPSALNSESRAVAIIECADAYTSDRAKLGNHAPLKVYMAIANKPRGRKAAWEYKALTGSYATFADAKAAAQQFYNKNPELFVDEIS